MNQASLTPIAETQQVTAASLRPGRYRLTADVPNPALDRRTRHDWMTTTPVFKAGMCFDVEEGAYSATFGDQTNHQWEIGLVGRRFSSQRVTVYSKEDQPSGQEIKENPKGNLGWLLLPHLVREDDNILRQEIVMKATKAADQATARADMVTYTEALKLIDDLLEFKPRLLSDINDGSDEGASIARRIKAIRTQGRAK